MLFFTFPIVIIVTYLLFSDQWDRVVKAKSLAAVLASKTGEKHRHEYCINIDEYRLKRGFAWAPILVPNDFMNYFTAKHCEVL